MNSILKTGIAASKVFVKTMILGYGVKKVRPVLERGVDAARDAAKAAVDKVTR